MRTCQRFSILEDRCTARFTAVAATTMSLHCRSIINSGIACESRITTRWLTQFEDHPARLQLGSPGSQLRGRCGITACTDDDNRNRTKWAKKFHSRRIYHSGASNKTYSRRPSHLPSRVWPAPARKGQPLDAPATHHRIWLMSPVPGQQLLTDTGRWEGASRGTSNTRITIPRVVSETWVHYPISRHLEKMHPEPASLTGLKLHVIIQGARWNEHLALWSTSGFPDPNPLFFECLHGPVPAAPHPSPNVTGGGVLQNCGCACSSCRASSTNSTLPLTALLHATHNNTLHSFSPK